MSLTVAEKQHWKERIARRIEKKIETLLAADPNLMDRIHRDARQRALQSLGLSEQTEAGLQIRSLVKTKTPKIEIHGYPARTDAHFRRLFAVIREYLDALDSGRFNYRPGFHCGMCDFATSHCRDWCG